MIHGSKLGRVERPLRNGEWLRRLLELVQHGGVAGQSPGAPIRHDVRGAPRALTGLSVPQGDEDLRMAGDKRAALQDFVARLANARRWGLGHPDDYAKTWSAIVGLPIEVGEKFYTRAKIQATPIDNSVIADEQKTIDLYYRSGLIGSRIDASTVVSAVFTPAIAAELAP